MKYKFNPKPKKKPAPKPIVEDESPDILEQVKEIVQGKLDTFRTELGELELPELEKAEDGDDGKDGEDGETPSEEYLLSLIEPLIPEPIPGVNGKDGRDGKDGIGRDGKDGANGRDGIDGKDGKDGQTIDNTKDFTSALAKITKDFEKKFEEYKKARDAEMRHLQSKTMTGGGGMGTIKYFKFTCNDTDTVFTLPDMPTQDGAAVFPRYQGQSLYPTDHFTVSGRTITMTFTGESGSFIDGFLIT